MRWILVDVAPRILPELGEALGGSALRILQRRGIDIRLGTSVRNVAEDSVQLSNGQRIDCRTLVWTAGVAANPLLATLDLETGRSGRLIVTPTLQTPQRTDVFAAGDAAAVPDLTKPGGTFTPPTAQHAQRQGVVLARNVARSLRGQRTQPYRHRDLGLVVDLGGTRSVARPLGHNLAGLPAQILTRGYHLSALPSMRAPSKAAVSWLSHAVLGGDFVRAGLRDVTDATLDAMNAEVSYLTGDGVRTLVDVLPSAPS